MAKEDNFMHQFNLVKKWFEDRGASVLPKKSFCAHGPDLVAITKTDAYRVEIKKLRYSSRSWRCDPVHVGRKNDDFIAIVFPCGYIFVERMADHLRCCNISGIRFFTILSK